MKMFNDNTQPGLSEKQLAFLKFIRLHAADMLDDNAVGEVRAYADISSRIIRDDELHMLFSMNDIELMQYLMLFDHIVFDGGNQEGYQWIATCCPAQLTIERKDENPELFTVIGYHDDTGRFWTCLISAANEQAAFYWAAKAAREEGHADVQFVTAIRGRHSPEKNLFFPGESTVCQTTLLESF